MKGLRNEVAKRRKNGSHAFEMKFRSKKDVQSLYLEKTAIKKLIHADSRSDFLSMYPTHVTNAIFLISKEASLLNERGKVSFDARLVMDKLGHFHIHATVERDEATPDNQGRGVVALDPGVRTFMTAYSPSDNTAFQIAPGCIQRLIRLEHVIDRLRSDIALLPAPCKSRSRRMQRAALRVHKRVKHLTSEAHWKAANFLTNRFHTIVLPPFATQRMCSRRGDRPRRIGRDTSRKMHLWSHYTFRTRLAMKCKERGCELKVLDEAYTTKTCTGCGWIHDGIGGLKVFRCQRCEVELDRDLNGARNIFLKHHKRLMGDLSS
jgi:putative transposase